MPSQNPILDNLAKALQEAAGAADGVRKEAETMLHSQMQRFAAKADLVPREEFEALQEMVLDLKREVAALKGGKQG